MFCHDNGQDEQSRLHKWRLLYCWQKWSTSLLSVAYLYVKNHNTAWLLLYLQWHWSRHSNVFEEKLIKTRQAVKTVVCETVVNRCKYQSRAVSSLKNSLYPYMKGHMVIIWPLGEFGEGSRESPWKALGKSCNRVDRLCKNLFFFLHTWAFSSVFGI